MYTTSAYPCLQYWLCCIRYDIAVRLTRLLAHDHKRCSGCMIQGQIPWSDHIRVQDLGGQGTRSRQLLYAVYQNHHGLEYVFAAALDGPGALWGKTLSRGYVSSFYSHHGHNECRSAAAWGGPGSAWGKHIVSLLYVNCHNHYGHNNYMSDAAWGGPCAVWGKVLRRYCV